MKKKTKALKLTLVISVLLIIGLVVFLVIPKEITERNYFNAIKNGFTKQVQQTQILENNYIVYEKTEMLVIDNNKAYHKITTKTLATSGDELYEIKETEYYYFENKIYYKSNNVWNIEEFKVNENLKEYNFKSEYFDNLNYDKQITEFGTLTANIKNENIKDVFNEENNFTNVSLEIIVNINFKIQELNFVGKTEFNRDFVINNLFTHNTESVTLPI